MTVARSTFADLAARGASVAWLLLIEGVPRVFLSQGTPAHVIVASGGDLDGDVWCGAGDLGALATPWLAWGVEIDENVRAPGEDPDLSTLQLAFTADPAALATAFRPYGLLRTSLWSTLSVSETTRVILRSNTGFASSGYIHIGRECIAYSGKGTVTIGGHTYPTLTGLTRAQFGTVAAAHTASNGTAARVPVGAPEVYGSASSAAFSPAAMLGRRVLLYLCEVSGANLINPALQWTGRVAAGSPSTDPRWVLQCVPEWATLSTDVSVPTVNLAGYVHVRGPQGFDGALAGLYPFVAYLGDDIAPGVPRRVGPLNDANTGSPYATTDHKGYHPDFESYWAALTAQAVASAAGGATYGFSLLAGGGIDFTVTNGTGGTMHVLVYTPFDDTWVQNLAIASGNEGVVNTQQPFPKAWIPLGDPSPLYLTQLDAAAIPQPLPGAMGGIALPTNVNTLTFGLLPPSRDLKVNASSTNLALAGNAGVSYRLAQSPAPGLFVRSVDTTDPSFAVLTVGAVDLAAVSTDHPSQVLTTPSAWTLGVYVDAADPFSAIQGVAAAYGLLGVPVDARSVDWARIAQVSADVTPAGLLPRRAYLTTQPVGKLLTQEASLLGCQVVPYHGRIAIVRCGGESAVGEANLGTRIRSSDYLTDPRSGEVVLPTLEECDRGIVNKFTAQLPDGSSVSIVAAADASTFGSGGDATEVQTVVHRGALSNVSREAIYAAITLAAGSTTGAYRRPYHVATFRLPLSYGDVQCGDAVYVDDWLLPNAQGGRGYHGTGVVTGRKLAVFEDAERGWVELRVRLSSEGIGGYAPAAFVASISGADVTLDTGNSFLGANQFSDAGAGDGGAWAFGHTAGAVVELVEIDSTSPHAVEQRTVVSVSGNVVTLDSAPDAFWGGAAGSGTYRVMLRYAPWTAATAGQQGEGYVWEADGQTLLHSDGTDPARYAP